jgi:hypothetical protein
VPERELPVSGPNEELLKAMHSSLTIRWGTSAPFHIGPISGEKVGFAQDPSVVLTVICREEDLSALVPIVRQRVYGELAERGWTPDDIGFTPGTQRNRRRKFIDQNESSDSYGKAKFGMEYRFRFDIVTARMKAATFSGGGSFKPIPQAPHWTER